MRERVQALPVADWPTTDRTSWEQACVPGERLKCGGAASNTSTYSMQLTGAQEVPANASPATADVTVTLNKTTGAVTVNGTFINLTSTATAAHIHGPAAVGANASVLIPLTIPSAVSGAVSGNGTMTTTQMNDMIGGMTYVNIHSMNYPDGEIRAQVVP